VRLATIDVQSYWHDEALTATLLRMPFGHMLAQLPKAELTPPLYYVLAWPWARLFGTGEVALRSFSALSGIALVPVVYITGRELVSRRVGLAVAALASFSPLLAWYSQEARPYSLLVLLGALSFLFFLRSLRLKEGRELVGWAVASILALLTHYFAAFLIIPEALYLIWRRPLRAAALRAAAAVAVAGLALIPLARLDLKYVSTSYISLVPLRRRALGVPEDFLTGFVIKWDTPIEKVLDAAAILVAGIALWLVATRTTLGERHAALLAGGAAALAVGVPAVLSLAGFDVLDTRNVIIAWLPAALVLAIGLTAARTALPAGIGGLAVLCAIGLTVSVLTQADPLFHREDFRGSARALGPARVARVIAVPAGTGALDYSLYLPRLRRLPPSGAKVSELDLVTPRSPKAAGPHVSQPARLPPPPAGFRLVERHYGETFTVLRYRASTPQLVGLSSAVSLIAAVMPQAQLMVQL